MEGEKKYTKVKIFLFLVFIVFAVILIATILRLMNGLFTGINDKTNEYKCNSLDYDLMTLNYKDNTLSFEIRSKETNMNLSKVLIYSGNETYEYIGDRQIQLGESLFVKLENVTLDSSFGISLNDCKNIKNVTLK